MTWQTPEERDRTGKMQWQTPEEHDRTGKIKWLMLVKHRRTGKLALAARRALCLLPTALCLLRSPVAADEPARPVSIESAQVTLIDQVRVPAKEAGVLAALDVREGDTVKAGQLLGTVESDREQVDKEQAVLEFQMAEEKALNDVDVRMAQKTRDVAKNELHRGRESVERFQKSISQTEIDRLQLTADKSELEVEKAQRDQKLARLDRDLRAKQVDAATLEIDRRRIVAPIDGMVVAVLHKQGEWVNPGDPVLRILRLDKLRVEGFLNAEKVSSNLLGRPVKLTVELPDNRRETFDGKIVFVDPEIEPVTGQFRVWAEVRNRDLLLSPGRHGALEIQR
jgi:macrolide-specific efflux system membrane fusion protein